VGIENFRPWLIQVPAIAISVASQRGIGVTCIHLFSLQNQCAEEDYFPLVKGVCTQVERLARLLRDGYLSWGYEISARLVDPTPKRKTMMRWGPKGSWGKALSGSTR